MLGEHAVMSRDVSSPCEETLNARLVTPQTLVAQAVGAALRSRGVVVTEGRALSGRPVDPSEVLLIIDDLVHPADVTRVLALVRTATRPVLVLTGRDRGHYWGALIAAGPVSVMSSDVGLDALEAALVTVSGGGHMQTDAEREELTARWEDFVSAQQVFIERLNALTPREQVVLTGLCCGESVSDLAVDLAVREATVRSHVKSILRKLHVRTQLAAVALAQEVQSPLIAGGTRLAAPVYRPRPRPSAGLSSIG